MDLVRKYNYRPNQLARGLAKKETQMLAIIVADLSGADYKIIKVLKLMLMSRVIIVLSAILIIISKRKRPI